MKKLALLLVFMALIAGHCFASDVGQIGYFVSASTSCPVNWVEPGVYFSSTTYPELAARVGCPSPNPCSLPALHGYFLRGWQNSQSIDVGRVRGSYQSNQFQTHGHSITDPSHRHQESYFYGAGGSGWGPSLYANRVTVGYGDLYTAYSVTGISVISPNSGSYGSETRPDNYSALVCVRAKDDESSGGSVMVSSVTLVDVSSTAAAALLSPGIFDHFTGGDLSFWLGIVVASFVVIGWRSGSR